MRGHIFTLFMVVALLQSLAAAPAVSISGTVTKSGGSAIKDVIVTLAGVSGVKDTTDASGKFSLEAAVAVKRSLIATQSLSFSLNGRELYIHSADQDLSGTASVYSSDGKRVSSVDFTKTNNSSGSILLPAFTAGLNILKITLNGKTYTSPLLQLPGLSARLQCVSGDSEMNQLTLAKSAAAAADVDTLILRKTGFTEKRTPVSAYTLSNLAITMDSIVATTCNATTLKAAGLCRSNHQILIGAAVNQSGVNSDIIAREFNYVTADNAMKWDATEGTENVFNFGAADQIVSAAQSKGIKIKGHALVWHNQLPNWVKSINSRDRIQSVMKNHIEKVMGHFGSKIIAWDVVNEALYTDNDNGSGNAKMRDTVFYKLLGEDFIPLAFKYAREYADSHNMKDMKLYYNDYSIDGDNDKSRFLRKKVKEWLDKGVPIDGIGFQMHIGPPNNIPTAQAVKDNMDYYASLGLDVLISEWDINLCGGDVSSSQQSQLYHDITQICVNNPRCVAITWWGVNDSESWLNRFNGSKCNGSSSQSLLFNNNQPKAVYTQVLNALNGK